MLSRFSLMTWIGAVLLLAGYCFAGTVAEDFAAANESYESGDYQKAIELYTGILDQGQESAPLYYNLGNAYFKDGDLGRSILYYMRAKRLDPGDDDIKSNLEFARQFTSLQMEGTKLNPIHRFMESIVEPYRLSFLAWVSSGLFVVMILLLALRYGFGISGSLQRVGLALALILLVLSSIITTYKYRTDYLTKRAVLIEYEVPVRSGPSERLDAEFEGVPGLIVEILSESGEYYNVLFENNRRGWIKKDLVAEI